MTKEEDFKLLKIQTCVLKVNIHCDGCKQKVKKLLQRIEGVYQVQIDAEQQKVTVSGSVDAATLIKKLMRAGKHAELWSSQKANQNQKQKNNCIKDEKNKGQKQGGQAKGLEAFKNQKFPAFFTEEDDDYYDEDDEDDEDDDAMRFIREKANQLNMLRQQQAAEANNAKKEAGAAISSAQNNGKMSSNAAYANGGKKGNPNQNVGMKGNPAGLDQKTMAALKMNNPHLGGGEGFNLGEAKRANDIGTMMSLAGFNGNTVNGGSATVIGSNPNSLGGFQVQPNNGIPGSSSAGLPNVPFATGQQYPASLLMNTNGFNNHPSQLTNMNMQNRHHVMQQQQPQMMYHRSPFVPPSTGYYYNYNPNTAYYSYSMPNYSGTEDHSAAHMFSDENTSSSCSIM